ncbi:MAG: ABC transporter substrate-binding protein [Betaproteobacteria bacterium]|nr:ABC transporter substrate-binding protein [Betaproteobacteria bacterium]
MMNRVRGGSLAGIVLSIGVFLGGTAGGALAQEKVKIRIGHLVHVTGAYAAGQAGIPEGFLDGIEAANTYMKIPGVVLDGFNMDGGTDTAKSMSAFKQMTEGKDAIAVMIGESTAVGIALKTWNNRKQVPNVEGGSDDEFLKLPSYTFSTVAPYVNQAGGWIDYYMKSVWPKKNLKRAPRFAWLTWDNSFGRAPITPKTIAYIKSKGIEIVDEEFIPPTPTDVGAQVLRMKEKGVDVTFGSMYHNALGVVLKEMDKHGLIDQIDIGLSYAIDPEALLVSVNVLARNVHITNLFWDFPNWEKHAPRYFEYYQKRKTPVSKFGYAVAFDKALVAAEAVRIAVATVGPDKVNGEAVYNALQKVNGFDAFGIGPAHSFSATKRYGQSSVYIMRLNNNKPNFVVEQPTPNLTDVK